MLDYQSQERHDAYAAFRVPEYRRFFLGLLLVHIGNNAQTLAIGWEIYKRTNNPLLLGLVGLIQAIPMMLFTLPAGYLADVYDRRKLVMHANFWTSVTSLALGIFSYYEGAIWLMYVLLFLDSAFSRIGWPAQSAIMPLLLPRDKFENAVKWQSSLYQVCAMAGPALAGFIVWWSLPAAYVFSALTTFAFTVVMYSIKVPNVDRQPPGQMLKQVGEGLQFVWRQKVLLGTISLDLFAVLLGGAVFLLPIFAKDIIDIEKLGMSPEQALGWLRAAPAAGAMLMAVAMAHLPPIRKAGRTMLLSVAAFGVATIVFALSTNFWLSIVMLALTGAFDNISVVVRHTLVQVITPDSMRGRTSAVNQVFIGSSNDLGGFESGLTAKWWGAVNSVIVGGIGTLVVVAMWAGLFPKLRKFGALTGEIEKK